MDFNGVVINSSATKITVAERFFGIELDPSQTARRSLRGALSERQYDILQRLVFWTSEALTAPPTPGALPVLNKLFDGIVDVHFITCLAPQGIQFGRQWLAEHQLPRKGLISVGRGGDKAWVLEAGFDAYVDDKGTVLNGLQGVVEKRFLFATPYNQNDSVDEDVIRVKDWQELGEHLMAV